MRWSVIAAILAGLLASVLLVVSAPASSKPTFEDQVGNWVVPEAPFQAAAAVWGVQMTYGGPAACEASPPGVQVICMQPTPGGILSEYFLDGRGIVLSPRLKGKPDWEIQELVTHEIGNALGVPEQPCGAHSAMSRCVDGYLNP